MPDPVPVSEMKLRPELMLAVCRALNFDPATFAMPRSLPGNTSGQTKCSATPGT